MDLSYMCFCLDRVIDVHCYFVNVGLIVKSTVTQPECTASVMCHSLAVLRALGRATAPSWESIYTLKSSKEPPGEKW